MAEKEPSQVHGSIHVYETGKKSQKVTQEIISCPNLAYTGHKLRELFKDLFSKSKKGTKIELIQDEKDFDGKTFTEKYKWEWTPGNDPEDNPFEFILESLGVQEAMRMIREKLPEWEKEGKTISRAFYQSKIQDYEEAQRRFE